MKILKLDDSPESQIPKSEISNWTQSQSTVQSNLRFRISGFEIQGTRSASPRGRSIKNHPISKSPHNHRGQATLETVIALSVVLIPLTFALISFSELVWTYHALTTLTRQGAQYAATHCFDDDSGSNVVSWMQTNSPAFPDRLQLMSGGIQIQVNYWTQDRENHQTVPFTCSGGCNSDCVPDSVTVSITGYEFNHFLSVFGVPPLLVPPFSTTVTMESAGGNPETAIYSR